MIPPPDIVRAAVRLQLSEQLIGFVGERSCAFLRAMDQRNLAPVNISINEARSNTARSFGARPGQQIASAPSPRVCFDRCRTLVTLYRSDQSWSQDYPVHRVEWPGPRLV